MGAVTGISWCHHTLNPWIGCARVSPACENCYAETLNNRHGWADWGVHGTRHLTSLANMRLPLRWNKMASEAGERRRVFCASLADIFENRDELKPRRAEVYDLTLATPDLDYLLLTKRIDHADRLWSIAADSRDVMWRSNHWLGTTVEDRKFGFPRIAVLRNIPAQTRFLSCEPLLEDLGDLDLTGIHWVIVGGESGGNPRPFNLAWARRLRDQCAEKGVAYFAKQLGANPVDGATKWRLDFDKKHGADLRDFTNELRVREFPTTKSQATR